MKPDGLACRDYLTENHVPEMTFNVRKNYGKWKAQIRNKFLDLTGLNDIANNACAPQLEIEKEEQKDGYKEIKFSGVRFPYICYDTSRNTLLCNDGNSRKY